MSEPASASDPPAAPQRVAVPDPLAALIGEAASKSGLLWVRPAGDRAWPAWHVWLDGSAYVVSGPGEQTLPELAGRVEVILRSKDTQSRLVTFAADAVPLAPEAPQWPAVTAALKGARLNAPDPDGLVERWAATDTITRLTPSGAVLEEPGRYADGSGSAPPAPTPATTSGWAPWHIGGRARTRRRRRRP